MDYYTLQIKDFNIPNDADEEFHERSKDSIMRFNDEWRDAIDELLERRKRKKFEEIFSRQLDANRKRAKLQSLILSIICGFILTFIFSSVVFLNPLENAEILLSGNYQLIELVPALFLCLFLSFALRPTLVCLLESKKEKMLLKDFDSFYRP